MMRAGCPWRLLPSDLPPWSTIYRWCATFRDEGRIEKINHAMVMLDRERVARQASPMGAIEPPKRQDGWRSPCRYRRSRRPITWPVASQSRTS